jgi:site-specific DNA recombinase
MVAYGFRLNPETKKLEINEKDAAVIRMIFEWCVEERLSCRKIADRLNSLGIPTHYTKDKRKMRLTSEHPQNTSGLWARAQVQNILRNTAYMGKWVYGKTSKKMRPENRIEVSCPEIISPSVFHIATEILKSNRWPEPHNRKRNYLLRGLMRCGICGSNYVGTTTKSRRGDERRYYRCNGRIKARERSGPKCMSKSVRGEALEDFIWNDIKEFVKHPDIALEQLRLQKAPVDAEIEELLTDTETKIEQLLERERNLLRVASESKHVDIHNLDKVLGEIRADLNNLTTYRQHLKTRLAQGEIQEREILAAADRLHRLRQRIDQASFQEKRLALESLISEIRVEKQVLHGKEAPIVIVKYRFNDPEAIEDYPSEVEPMAFPIEFVTEASTSTPQ